MISRFGLVISLLYVSGVIGNLEQLCHQITFFDKLSILPECLAYGAYGCWCGAGGSGTPLDGTDRCCMYHDFCYDGILKSNECSPYFATYKYDNGKCYGDPNSCEYKTCMCDNIIARCFSKNKFIKKHWGWTFWNKC